MVALLLVVMRSAVPLSDEVLFFLTVQEQSVSPEWKPVTSRSAVINCHRQTTKPLMTETSWYLLASRRRHRLPAFWIISLLFGVCSPRMFTSGSIVDGNRTDRWRGGTVRR